MSFIHSEREKTAIVSPLFTYFKQRRKVNIFIFLDNITSEKLEALEHFLDVLKNYFPMQSVLHKVLQRITIKDLITTGITTFFLK